MACSRSCAYCQQTWIVVIKSELLMPIAQGSVEVCKYFFFFPVRDWFDYISLHSAVLRLINLCLMPKIHS